MKVQKIRTIKFSIDNVDFFGENHMANTCNATEEQKKTIYYSFSTNVEDLHYMFSTMDEALLAYVAHKNGAELNDIFTIVNCAYKILRV